MLGAAALGAYNNDRTIRRQDQQAATSIQNQGRIQRQVDQRVDDEVRQLEQSSAADERAKALQGYMDTLGRNRRALEAGLTPTVGSDAFRESSAQATGDVNQYASRAAELMSRIDAPSMQRQGEAFGYGRLATDVNTLGRTAQGEAFLDEMRMRAIRRNPWIDAVAGGLAAYGGTRAGAGSGASSGTEVYPYATGTSQGHGWWNGYGAGMTGRGPNYGYGG
jgi:hypothetical protein